MNRVVAIEDSLTAVHDVNEELETATVDDAPAGYVDMPPPWPWQSRSKSTCEWCVGCCGGGEGVIEKEDRLRRRRWD